MAYNQFPERPDESVGSWMLTLLLCGIPVIGFIYLLVLAFGRLGGKRSVFDDGEHFDDRDTGQQFLAHISNPNVWTDQLIGEDHTTECDRSPMVW